jgi:hexosaminidase
MKDCITFVFTFIFLSFFQISHAKEIALIPQPETMVMKAGEFSISAKTMLIVDSDNKELQRIAGFLNDYLKKYYHFTLSKSGKTSDFIRFQLVKSDEFGKEGYKMSVNKNGILIIASNPNGIFYGVQTIKQLIPINSGDSLMVPCLEIKDKPRFSWRGMHLDVGRHFFPAFYVKEYIDFMAMYKMNVFHWHLTEDQGWRLQIRKYPLLVEKGSWRDETFTGGFDADFFQERLDTAHYDGIGVGGFYSQDQVRDIVRYAAERYVTIVPEIEMPGHCCAALAAYPELGCTGGPYEVLKKWGVVNDVFCPGKEQTFTFIRNVLDEVCELFPSPYIHIGGDECSKVLWKNCPDCQRRIQSEKLKNEEELQSYFIKRIEKYLISKNKKMIGWEEILEGGLAPEATVMAWKATQAGSQAIREKHDVIRCPSEYCYFNHYNVKNPVGEPLAYRGNVTLEKVYSFDPIPEGFSNEDARFIIGSEGCAWSEYIPNIKTLEYQVFPRACAMSEVLWTPVEKKDFSNFKLRMETEFKRLKRYQINYCDHPY